MNGSGAFPEAVAATDVGRRRHNEDAYLVHPDVGLLVVADGVGGHDAGEVASAITCETIVEEVQRGASLQDAVRAANLAVMHAVDAGRGREGMASTVVAVQCKGAEFEVAWVGDSRAYLWDGSLKLITRDHSLMETLLSRGEITREEARQHPQRNVIVQAIGLQAENALRVDSNSGTLQEGQILLLCSDGMSDILENETIVDILTGEGDLQERCQRLVSRSIEEGGKDNSTVVLVAGTVPAGGEVREPDAVWRYDPTTGKTMGLLEVAPVAPAAPAIKKVGPKVDAEAGDSPQTTQMMSIAEVERALAAKGQLGGDDRRSAGGKAGKWLVIGALVLAAAAAAGYFVSVGGVN